MKGPVVERYEPGLRAIWDDVVKRARARHFMFERAYMDYHADRFADASLLVSMGRQASRSVPRVPT